MVEPEVYRECGGIEYPGNQDDRIRDGVVREPSLNAARK